MLYLKEKNKKHQDEETVTVYIKDKLLYVKLYRGCVCQILAEVCFLKYTVISVYFMLDRLDRQNRFRIS